ncbi:hypothetical protein JRO89_XS05G0075000 [Xanthoceras sorbifolium]|uniref:WAT1-related protein n=1 Tax=Xanthoceras sorbifolium TaxID=99658 RepID=A0ABQ8I0U3_9ROSI|nr:hypothetical protein JRO89_XS05G0075000 [Xanthoceras sorbifolium]
MGTIVLITGALIMTYYKGTPLLMTPSSHKPGLQLFLDKSNWVIGGLLLAIRCIFGSAWLIVQLGTMRQYPQVMKAVSSYSLAGTLQCAMIGLIVERDLKAWKLKLNMDLLLIVVTAIFGSIIRTSVHVVCSRMKGPFYVAMFKPFGIVFATIFGVSFFTNALHYGRTANFTYVKEDHSEQEVLIDPYVIGAIVTGMGYYTVMWGQITEQDELRKGKNIESDEKVRLLQEENEV